MLSPWLLFFPVAWGLDTSQQLPGVPACFGCRNVPGAYKCHIFLPNSEEAREEVGEGSGYSTWATRQKVVGRDSYVR